MKIMKIMKISNIAILNLNFMKSDFENIDKSKKYFLILILYELVYIVLQN